MCEGRTGSHTAGGQSTIGARTAYVVLAAASAAGFAAASLSPSALSAAFFPLPFPLPLPGDFDFPFPFAFSLAGFGAAAASASVLGFFGARFGDLFGLFGLRSRFALQPCRLARAGGGCGIFVLFFSLLRPQLSFVWWQLSSLSSLPQASHLYQRLWRLCLLRRRTWFGRCSNLDLSS